MAATPDAVKTVFFAALEMEAAERPSFLDCACRDDTDLRHRVEELLRVHDGSDALLDRPAAWHLEMASTGQKGDGNTPLPHADTLLEQPAVTHAGRFRLLGEIARGGMGAVLRAHDPEMDRALAVKVVLPQHRDNPSLSRRFLGEARLAGQLQHPGVVPVYDVGRLEDGRPFFAMKLIEGRTLAQLLRERPDPGHDLPRFLRHFEAVCQAAGYAHSRGVIHRDLKPANVMVGAFGEVQVMDWGLARRKDGGDEAHPANGSAISPGADRTHAGTVIGTPGYMAPEQARGEAICERSDVFGLGAILCEILTGAPPFAGEGLMDALALARRADLAGAFERLDRCGADAELLRLARECLSPRPEDRPADGAAVAERVAAHLAGLQERLQHAELGKARAEARAEGERARRRLTLGLAAALVGLVVLVAIGVLAQQRQQAEQARQQEQRRQASEAALAKAADLLESRRYDEARAVLEQASGRLEEGDEELGQKFRRALAEMDLTQQLEGIRVKASTQSATDLERGWQPHVAGIDRQYAEAFRAAGLSGLDDPPEQVAERVRASGVRSALVVALDAWAALPGEARRREWALRVALAADAGGNEWGRRVREQFLANDPAALEVLVREVPVDRVSAHLLFLLSHALKKSPAVIPFLEKSQVHYPGDFWLNMLLAHRLDQAGRTDESIRYYQAALAVRPNNQAALHNMAITLKRKGELKAAEACLRRAVELDPNSLVSLMSLGNVLADLRQHDEAIAFCRKAIALDANDARANDALGGIFFRQKRKEEALALFYKAVALDPNYAHAHNSLGVALLDKKELTAATASCRKAIELLPDRWNYHLTLGAALYEQKLYAEAVACFRQAIALNPRHPDVHTNLGLALVRQGNMAEAIACFRRALELAPASLIAHGNLGKSLIDEKRYAEALPILLRTSDLTLKRTGRKDARMEAQIGECRKRAELELSLPDALSGWKEPASVAGRLEQIDFCVKNQRFVSAALLFEKAFRADPKLADDPKTAHRYQAARSATLSAAGQGRDAGTPDDRQKAAMRKRALDWLRADLAALAKQPGDERSATLRRWLTDDAFASVRGEEALGTLPVAERKTWGDFWNEVHENLRVKEGR